MQWVTTVFLTHTCSISQANRWAGQRRRPDYLDPCGGMINACADVVGPDESITCPDLLVPKRRPHSLAVGSHQVLILSRLSTENGLSVLANWPLGIAVQPQKAQFNQTPLSRLSTRRQSHFLGERLYVHYLSVCSNLPSSSGSPHTLISLCPIAINFGRIVHSNSLVFSISVSVK